MYITSSRIDQPEQEEGIDLGIQDSTNHHPEENNNEHELTNNNSDHALENITDNTNQNETRNAAGQQEEENPVEITEHDIEIFLEHESI